MNGDGLKKLNRAYGNIEKGNPTIFLKDEIIGIKNHIIFLERDIKKLKKENEKRKRVIEIIKSKKVDMRYFLECVGVDTYNFWATKEGAGALTQQEHDLLNEVLLCK